MCVFPGRSCPTGARSIQFSVRFFTTHAQVWVAQYTNTHSGRTSAIHCAFARASVRIRGAVRGANARRFTLVNQNVLFSSSSDSSSSCSTTDPHRLHSCASRYERHSCAHKTTGPRDVACCLRQVCVLSFGTFARCLLARSRVVCGCSGDAEPSRLLAVLRRARTGTTSRGRTILSEYPTVPLAQNRRFSSFRKGP